MKKKLVSRINNYLPGQDIIAIKPTSIDLERKEAYLKNRPADEFALVLYQKKILIIPSWHPLNLTPKASSSSVYGTGCMETLTLEPILKSLTSKEIIGANIVLLNPRIKRLFRKALPSREIELPISESLLSQGIIDLMTISGKKLLEKNEVNIPIASIRVTAGFGMGQFGKSAVGQSIDLTVESYSTSKSYSDEKYNNGLSVCAGPYQRFQKFSGKQSSHYGDIGRIGLVSKKIGADDTLFFAPHIKDKFKNCINLLAYSDEPNKQIDLMMSLALSNALGAEIMAVSKEGRIYLPPMRVNRLGGVTANYIFDYLAPSLNIKVQKREFSINQIVSGDIAGLLLVGNAARIAPVSTILVHDENIKIIKKIELKIPNVVRKLMRKFENEVRNKKKSSYSHLVVKINFEEGDLARITLKEYYKDWF